MQIGVSSSVARSQRSAFDKSFSAMFSRLERWRRTRTNPSMFLWYHKFLNVRMSDAIPSVVRSRCKDLKLPSPIPPQSSHLCPSLHPRPHSPLSFRPRKRPCSRSPSRLLCSPVEPRRLHDRLRGLRRRRHERLAQRDGRLEGEEGATGREAGAHVAGRALERGHAESECHR